MRALPQGFTLIEILIALSIFAFLLMIAGPQYADFMANMQIRNAAENTLTGVRLAQGEAVRSNAQSQFILDPTPCSGGWQVKRMNNDRRARCCIVHFCRRCVQDDPQHQSDDSHQVHSTAWDGSSNDATETCSGRCHDTNVTSPSCASSSSRDRRAQTLATWRRTTIRVCVRQRNNVMKTSIPQQRQQGAYLLEALIGILTFSSILGIVGCRRRPSASPTIPSTEAMYLATR
jgi:prepilin-type N-terminal cleavage/methylation domain-containing protein